MWHRISESNMLVVQTAYRLWGFGKRLVLSSRTVDRLGAEQSGLSFITESVWQGLRENPIISLHVEFKIIQESLAWIPANSQRGRWLWLIHPSRGVLQSARIGHSSHSIERCWAFINGFLGLTHASISGCLPGPARADVTSGSRQTSRWADGSVPEISRPSAAPSLHYLPRAYDPVPEQPI